MNRIASISLASVSLVAVLVSGCSSSSEETSHGTVSEPITRNGGIPFPCGNLEVRCTANTWACGTEVPFSQHCFASAPPANLDCCQGYDTPPPADAGCTPNPNACANDDLCNGNRKCGRVSDGCGGFVDCGGCNESEYFCGSNNRCTFEYDCDCGGCPDGQWCSLVQTADTCVTCACQ